ncbi:MAG: hypothetical protein JWN14_3283 [Chthonomonadales bacterium]|nr:hypothetical protein [Chthonomonadales bacterium]
MGSKYAGFSLCSHDNKSTAYCCYGCWSPSGLPDRLPAVSPPATWATRRCPPPVTPAASGSWCVPVRHHLPQDWSDTPPHCLKSAAQVVPVSLRHSRSPRRPSSNRCASTSSPHCRPVQGRFLPSRPPSSPSRLRFRRQPFPGLFRLPHPARHLSKEQTGTCSHSARFPYRQVFFALSGRILFSRKTISRYDEYL